MNKFNFIKQLLENEKFNPSQKDRFLKLVSKELSVSEEIDKQIIQDIDLLKKEIGLKSDQVKSKDTNTADKHDIIQTNLPEYIDPKYLSGFLFMFNQNPVLKYTCHLIDADGLNDILKVTKSQKYSFKKHKKEIEKEYGKLLNIFNKNISSNIKAQVGEYLNDFLKKNKGWSQDKIPITWSSKYIENWCNENEGKCPCPDESLGYNPCYIKPIDLNNGDTINNFSELVLHFKKQIQFRESNSLKDSIEEINFEYRDKASFNTDDIRTNIEFFTDTEKVKQAYKHIINLVLYYFKETKKEGQPQFQISLKEVPKEKKIIFSILNTNSIFGKSLETTLSKRGVGRDLTNLIEKLINGVCDLSIRADFGNTDYAEVAMWPKRTIPETLDNFKGVQFNLIFYRT